MDGDIALREKFYGCIAGVHIGSAMAAPVEGDRAAEAHDHGHHGEGGRITAVDHAASVNPYTNSRRTLREHADGLYGAISARLDTMDEYLRAMRSEM